MKAALKFDDTNPHLPCGGKSGTLTWDAEFQPSRAFIEVSIDRLKGYSFDCNIGAKENSITFWNHIYANDKTVECLRKSFAWLDIVVVEN